MAHITTAARRCRHHIAVCAGMLLTLAAAWTVSAQTAGAATFIPPGGCSLNFTVQNRSCTVSQHYTCTSDPAGWQHSAHFGRDGMYHLSTIDPETRWIESQSIGSGIVDTLVEKADSHASFSRLLDSGRDDFDFWTETSDGQRLHHQGFDTLTGETAQIDGQPLERTEFHLTTRDAGGQVLIERQGGQFISRKFRRFFGGTETSTDWTGAKVKSNDSPVLFIFPGEPGFASTTPQFDCDQLLTQIMQERAAS